MAKATSPVPVPTDPVELLSTPLARSGLAAGATLRRAGIKLDFYTVRDLFHRIPGPPHWKPALGGLLVGLLGIAAPEILGSGYGWVPFTVALGLSVSPF